MNIVVDLIHMAARQLNDAKTENPIREARLLLALSTGRSEARLIGGDREEIQPEHRVQFLDTVARRCTGEPIARIFQKKSFLEHEFELNDATLVPRPETEMLVEISHDRMLGRPDEQLRILDLGTGSGCILISLLDRNKLASGLGVDVQPGALRMARHNAQRLGVARRAEWFCGNWMDALPENGKQFDLIVSNPPYIDSIGMKNLPSEVAKFDPHLALFGGRDGCDAYRQIISGATSRLTLNGIIVLEVTSEVCSAVEQLMFTYGFQQISVFSDLQGISRVVIANVGSCTE